MSAVVAGLLFFVSAAALFLVGGALVTALVSVLLRRWLPTLEAASRHRVLLVLAALPVVLGVSLLAIACVPAAASFVSPLRDHCLRHDDVHAHLCFVHLPKAAHVSVWLPLAVVVTALAGALRAAAAVRRVHRALRWSAQVLGSATPHLDGDFLVLEAGASALAVGLWSPRVLIGRDLMCRLPPAQLDIVVAHERAHARRRDPLLQLLACSFLAFHFAQARRWLADELAVAAEQACDDVAARACGDRLAVAETILHLARSACAAGPRDVALAMGETAVERRVAALLEAPGPELPASRFALSLGCVALALLSAAEPIHHGAEVLLSLFAG